MLRVRVRSVVLSLALLPIGLAACDGGAAPTAEAASKQAAAPTAKKHDEAPAAQTEAKAAVDAPAPEGAAPKAAPAEAAPAEEMPPLASLSPGHAVKPVYQMRESLDQEGLALHKAGDYVGSAEKFRAAVEADPSAINARYNLACAYAKQGKRAWAMTILQDFAKDGSLATAGRLLRAKGDRDFESLYEDPAFIELTSVEDQLPTLDEAGAQVETWAKAWAEAGKAELPAVFEERLELGLVVEDWGMGEDRSDTKRRLEDLGQFEFILRKHRDASGNQTFTLGDQRKCKKRCCSWEESEGVMPNNLYLSEVCFKMSGEGVLFASRLVLASS